MIRLLTVIGARPQIIKAAAISRAVKNSFSDKIEERILHTGQHYDANMSQVFFDELDIPAPHYNLGVGSSSHGEQTAKMIDGIESVLRSEHFDGIILYGDTNSTLAGAVAAAKMQVPVFHIEAGLRSFNMTMPEEQNRIVCDHLSSILFAPTQIAIRNLEGEGLTSSKALFCGGKGRLVINSGDVMYDNALFFSKLAQKKSTIFKDCRIEPRDFILATVHRDFNTDNPDRIGSIFRALSEIADIEGIAVVLPLHPRTRKYLPDNLSKRIIVIPPASFFDILVLEKNAKVIMTDSGGVQKEAFFFGRPCVILRPETEWVEILDHNAGILADADYDRIIQSYKRMKDNDVVFPPLFGDGNAALKILRSIWEYIN
ncbi:MAG: UDP-N-acetylglucosamine 2-epimerase (non-hydrolyzing) [Bacteroidales bacterium]|nr:UDP-N-acetylglucosamine 2-epimerase (non-hydrolyzing) [Bacteroidales bacterium]